jgi:uncharacterized membrane protein YdjX (TVP38/TMEM64 family)
MKINMTKLKFYIFIFSILAIISISIILNSNGYILFWYNSFKEMNLGILLALIYISLYIISSFLPLPLLPILGASIFPFYEALILSIIGNIIFFTLTFYMTRWFGRKYVGEYEKSHPKLEKFSTSFSENSFLYIFLLRLSFIIPRQAVNTLAGLSKMEFKDYIFASFLGIIPVVSVSILFVKGYQIKETSLIIISLILLGLFIILPFLLIKGLRKYFKKDVSQK